MNTVDKISDYPILLVVYVEFKHFQFSSDQSSYRLPYSNYNDLLSEYFVVKPSKRPTTREANIMKVIDILGGLRSKLGTSKCDGAGARLPRFVTGGIMSSDAVRATSDSSAEEHCSTLLLLSSSASLAFADSVKLLPKAEKKQWNFIKIIIILKK